MLNNVKSECQCKPGYYANYLKPITNNTNKTPNAANNTLNTAANNTATPSISTANNSSSVITTEFNRSKPCLPCF